VYGFLQHVVRCSSLGARCQNKSVLALDTCHTEMGELTTNGTGRKDVGGRESRYLDAGLEEKLREICERSGLQRFAIDGLDMDRIASDASSGGSDCKGCILTMCERCSCGSNGTEETCSLYQARYQSLAILRQ
jgi:hypothetical protein